MTPPTRFADCRKPPLQTRFVAPKSRALRRRRAACAARRFGRLLALAAIVCGWAALASANDEAGSAAQDAGSALTLSNEHVGMTREEIESAQAKPAVEPAPAPASSPDPAPGEPEPSGALEAPADALRAQSEAAKRRADEAAERAEALQRAVEAAEAGLIPGVGSNTQGPASYATCLEASIRRGLSYAESDRLCRAVFPEAAD